MLVDFEAFLKADVCTINWTLHKQSASCVLLSTFNEFVFQKCLSFLWPYWPYWVLSLKQMAIGNLFVRAVPKPNLMTQMNGGQT